MIPNTSHCGAGIVWFVNDQESRGFRFKNAEHKACFIRNDSAVNYLDPKLTEKEKSCIPSLCDYIYFRWLSANTDVNVSHVGIVAAVGDDSLTTWEGNSGDKAVNRTFVFADARIVGYRRPDYENA
jgi:hypothetical protein